MAGHELIDTYLASVARRGLPGDVIDELADGLTETYEAFRGSSMDAETAAQAAIREFGTPDVVVSAFIRQSAGRRGAYALICSGPVVGCAWVVTVVSARAWTWPIFNPARAFVGAALLTVVVLLLVAATARRSFRRTRMAGYAGLTLIGVDGLVLTAVALIGPSFVWPLAVAVPASAARLVLTARALPAMLRR